ncbi:hypothetical protein D3C81_1465210 [compost metagenome]
MPEQIAAVMEQLQFSRDEVCGNCANCNPETKLCNENGYQVRPADPGCWAFIARQ